MPDSPADTPSPDDNLHNSEIDASQPGDLASTRTLDPVQRPGSMLGAYHLLDLIGEGGMGEVWRAEQSFPVRRRVAVKLIKAGMDTRAVVARFESERQALALMDHPTIAKVFDAGSTLEGRPYFVMEYVTGTPITVYCDEHKLTTRERLQLFIHVCEGVQHAHQKAIIHRDLKPSNILVTEVDGKPVPKIIDFGVAKAISHRLTHETFFTGIGTILGTPDYMSPEQASSAGEDIDTRADVYSLGIVLYELLVGALPFDFRKLAFDEILRHLRQAEVTRPSTKLRTLHEQSTTAQNRRTEPAALIRQLRGDLDAITLKTLEKDRLRRYGAPSELAADISRYLRSEPVTARVPSVSYRARKYIRRHRAGVAVASALLLLLASFAITEAIQLRRTTRERDRADRITDFMTRMFKVSNPSESLGNKVTAREILDRASKDIGSGLADDPALQAQMMDVMGTVYYNLGLYPQAESLFRRALQIHHKVFGPQHLKTAQSMNSLANTLDEEGHRADAAKLYAQALEIRRRVLGPEHPDTLKSINNLAITLVEQGRYREAEKLGRQVLDVRRRVLGPEHPDTLTSMDNLGDTLHSEGHHAEAEKLNREALEITRRVLGLENPATLRAMHHVANLLYDEGRYAEAEKLDREMLEIRRRVLGPDHPDTLDSLIALANTLSAEGRDPEAEKLDREAVDIQRRVLGPDHPETLLAMGNLAAILGEEHQYEAGEKLERAVVDTERRVLGPEHPNTLYSISKLASILILRQHYDEAEKLSLQTLEIQRRVLGPDHPDTADTIYNLACIAAQRGRPDEAFSFLRNAVDHGLKPNDALGMESDPSLKPLRRDPRFSALLSYARARATTATNPH
ncbi:MAG: tetratricopeptide repeat protein [Bryobacteraceae bacterium]